MVDVLYSNEYFSFIEDAKDYVNMLFDKLHNELPYKKYYKTPKNLLHFGDFYVKLKGSKRTTCYAFFIKSQNKIIVKHIANNHTEIANFLND